MQKDLSYLEGVKLIKELSNLGTKSLLLSGGEPMMRKDIYDLIKTAKQEKLSVAMITNGTLITKTSAEKLIQSGLDSITFSIDSPEPEPHDAIRGVEGTWEKAIKGIKNIRDIKRKYKNKKIEYSLFFLINSTNYHLIEKMISLKPDLEYKDIHFSPLIPKTNLAKELIFTKENLDDLNTNYLPQIKETMKKYGFSLSSLSTINDLSKNIDTSLEGKYAKSTRKEALCFQPWHMFTIDPYGKVYPCCHACTFQNLSEDLTHGFWGPKDFTMGDIRKNSLQEIWNSDNYIKFRNECKKNPLPFTFCAYCDYSPRYDLFLTALFKKRKLLFKTIRSLFN
jgi:radical SAM protein with 4Fe4S-binding SPASM domain